MTVFLRVGAWGHVFISITFFDIHMTKNPPSIFLHDGQLRYCAGRVSSSASYFAFAANIAAAIAAVKKAPL